MSRRSCFAITLMTACLLAPCTAAEAQPSRSDMEFVVAQREMPLKCGAAPGYYQIGEVAQGQIVEVLQRRWDWAQVRSQLEPLEGYVPLDDTEPGANDDEVITVRRVSLRAPNTGGWKKSFIDLVMLDAGTRLRVVEPFEEGGRTYLTVLAPTTAGAWLPESALVPASDGQVQAYLQEVRALQGAVLEALPVPVEEVTPLSPPVQVASAPDTNTETIAEEAITPEESNAPVVEPQIIVPQLRSRGEQQAAALGVLTPAQLYTLADALLKENIRIAEFGPALVEFRRSMDALELNEHQVKALMRQRLALELRQRVQQRLLTAEQALVVAEDQATDLQRRERVSEGPVGESYSGQLLPSQVFTGNGLPKLYRLQSLARLSRRTQAYIEQGDFDSLPAFLDQRVIVWGEIRFDEDLQIYIITPRELEVVAVTEE